MKGSRHTDTAIGDAATAENTYAGGTAPYIRRMRGWRLYAEDGRRFLDLRLLDNRGFLGAKGRSAGTRAKNGIDLGLLKEAPSRQTALLERELRKAFPDSAAFRFFRNEERALASLENCLEQSSRENLRRLLRREGLYDPLRRTAQEGQTEVFAAVERFFLEDFGLTRRSAPVRLVPLPCPEPFRPGVLAFPEASAAERVEGDMLPPIMSMTALRAWADFLRDVRPLEGGRRVRSGEGAPPYTEALWKRTDRRLSPYFERRGPYLYAQCPEARWPEFLDRAMAGGCLLTPKWDLPSIVPGEFDDGELKKLAEALSGL